jgi:8-oxo-dGTP diphosphatase
MRRTESPPVSVYALIRKNGRVLLTRDLDKPGWKLPGGAVEDGELLMDALRREIREEVNLEIKVRRLLAVVNWLKKDSARPRIRIYFGADASGGRLTPAADEVAAARWFSLEELRRLNKKDFWLPQHYYRIVRLYLEGRGAPLTPAGRRGARGHELIPGT